MLTFSQVRGRLVAAALTSLGRTGIVDQLLLFGSFPRAGDDRRSTRALAYRLAWLLLPAAATHVKCADAALDCNAALCRADARTGRKGGSYVR